MAHIHEHSQPLRTAEKVLSLLRQAGAGHAGASQRIFNMPDQRDHPHALLIRLVEPSGVAADGLRTLDSEESGGLSLRHGLLRILCRPAEGGGIRVSAQLRGKIVQRTAVLLRVRQIVFDPRRAERKELRIASEVLRLLQRNGQGILPQAFAAHPQLHRRIAMSVKNSVFHQNASSISRISGAFVCIPSGA